MKAQQRKNRSGLLVVISGPSCSGKTTMAQLLLEVYAGVASMSVSATTRSPRYGETHGVDYWFLSKEDFLHRKEEGDFYETNFYTPSNLKTTSEGVWYGTPKTELDAMLARWSPVIAVLDVNGHKSIRKTLNAPILSFFLSAPVKELRRRMKTRGCSRGVMEYRMSIAREEMRRAGEFDVHIVNKDIHRTKHDMVEAINSHLKNMR